MTTFKEVLPFVINAIVGAVGLGVAGWYAYSVLTSVGGTFRFVGIAL